MNGIEMFDRSGLGWRVHLLAVGVLLLATSIRFWPTLTAVEPAVDERVYLDAFETVAGGGSPYTRGGAIGFYYPPAFALAGAAASRSLGAGTILVTLRAANVLGLAVLVWCSLLFAPLAWGWLLVLGVGFVALAPAVELGVASGNLSFAVIGAVLVALYVWRRQPWVSGAVLAAATLVKPIAPVAMVVLAAHCGRPPTAAGRKAALLACALAGGLLLTLPYLGEFLTVEADPRAFPLNRTVSLYRWLDLLGLRLPPVALLAAVTLVVLRITRSDQLTDRQLLVLALAGMTLATPALWSHSLLLTLPLQVMALALAWRRWREPNTASSSPVRRYEPIFVLLMVAALQFADGVGGVNSFGPLVQIPTLAVPVFAPLALAWYVWRRVAQ